MTTWNTGAQPVVAVDPATGSPSVGWADRNIFYCSVVLSNLTTPITALQMRGVNGKSVRIESISIDGTATPGSRGFGCELNRRSTLATGGTPAAETSVPEVPGTALPGITITSFTSAPTPGAGIGLLYENQFMLSISTSSNYFDPHANRWIFGENGPVLASADDILTFDILSNTSTIASLYINIIYAEVPTR